MCCNFGTDKEYDKEIENRCHTTSSKFKYMGLILQNNGEINGNVT